LAEVIVKKFLMQCCFFIDAITS